MTAATATEGLGELSQRSRELVAAAEAVAATSEDAMYDPSDTRLEAAAEAVRQWCPPSAVVLGDALLAEARDPVGLDGLDIECVVEDARAFDALVRLALDLNR